MALSPVREVAREIKNWAIRNRMMAEVWHSPEVNMPIIQGVFGKVGVPVAGAILQKRRISYIGVDDEKNKVIVFVEKRLTVRESSMLQYAGTQTVHVEFQEGALAHNTPEPAFPAAVPTYVEHNGLYTCGSSISMGSEKSAGTLGCLVKDKAGALFGLSNNHVIGASNYASPGLPIVAPGIADVAAGEREPATIGLLYQAQPFVDGIPEIVNTSNNLDAAIFSLKDSSLLSSMQRNHYDTPNDVCSLKVGMAVEKVGRTTGRISGTVVAQLFDPEPVLYEMPMMSGLTGRKHVFFEDMFVVIADQAPLFTAPGDSGSLVTFKDQDDKRWSVGLIVGGDGRKVSFALPIDRVLEYFNVSIVSGHNI